MYFAKKLDRFSACLLIPGRTTDSRGFVVGDGMIEGLRGDVTPAVSIEAIRNAASRIEQIGLVDVGALELAQEHLAATEALLDQANARVAELEANQERIIGLRKAGFHVQKQAGRPKAKEATS